ncbi:transmembrane protein [Cystoisospora suis]|uniref:Transmembrane protein n=1 Tax=Cystoisospora suis TaxID=483139 RepID=A0A2C6KQD5_9APIC|nr:transmembrane protein [Cystoisospora suis]
MQRRTTRDDREETKDGMSLTDKLQTEIPGTAEKVAKQHTGTNSTRSSRTPTGPSHRAVECVECRSGPRVRNSHLTGLPTSSLRHHLNLPAEDFEAGLAKRRHCTDIMFLIVFLIAIAGSVFVSVIAFQKGDPARLLTGRDFDGAFCGLAEFKTEAYPLVGYTLNLQRVLSSPSQSEFSEMNYSQLGDMTIFNEPQHVMAYLQPVCLASCVTIKDIETLAAGGSQRKVVISVDGKDMGSFCVPALVEHDTIFFPFSAYVPKRLAAGWQLIVQDLSTSWPAIVMCGGCACIIALLWQAVLRWVGGSIVYISISLFLGVIIASGGVGMWFVHSEAVPAESVRPGDVPSGTVVASIWIEVLRYASYIVLGLGAVFAILLLFLTRRIREGVAISKVSAMFVYHKPTVVSVPFCVLIIYIAYLCYWLYTAACLITAVDILPDNVNAIIGGSQPSLSLYHHANYQSGPAFPSLSSSNLRAVLNPPENTTSSTLVDNTNLSASSVTVPESSATPHTMKKTKRRSRQPPQLLTENPAGTPPFTPAPVSHGNVSAQPYPVVAPEIAESSLAHSPVLSKEKENYTPGRSDSTHTSLRQGVYRNAVRSAPLPSIHPGVFRPTTGTSTAPPWNYFPDVPVERYPGETYFPPQTPRSSRKANEAPPPDPELFVLNPELLNPAMSAELAAMGNLNTEIQNPWQQRPVGRQDSAERMQRRGVLTPDPWGKLRFVEALLDPSKPSPMEIASLYYSSQDAIVDAQGIVAEFTKRVQLNETTMNLLWFHIFILLWVYCFLHAFNQIVLAGAVARWYFIPEDSRGKKRSRGVICKSWAVAVNYHLGSLAFGSFILASIKLCKWILKYLAAQQRHINAVGSAKACTKCSPCGVGVLLSKASACNGVWVSLIGILGYLVKCFEKCIEFLDRHAFIQVALKGKNFCRSAKTAFGIFMQNPARIAVALFLGKSISFIGGIVISALSTTAGFFITRQLYGSRLNSLVPPTVGCGVISLLVGILFQEVYRSTIAACIHCYIADQHISRKLARPPVYTPEPLLHESLLEGRTSRSDEKPAITSPPLHANREEADISSTKREREERKEEKEKKKEDRTARERRKRESRVSLDKDVIPNR